VAEELSFPDRSDGALFTVYPELEFLSSRNRVTDSITRCPAASDRT
jgi:hypothetical protein